MSGLKEKFEQEGSLQSLGKEKLPSSDTFLASLRIAAEDVTTTVEAVGDLESGLPFVKNTLFQSYAENLLHLQSKVDNFLNAGDSSSGKKPVSWKGLSDAGLTIARTAAQPAANLAGVRLDWNSNKYYVGLQGIKDTDENWKNAMLRGGESEYGISGSTVKAYLSSTPVVYTDESWENAKLRKRGSSKELGVAKTKTYYSLSGSVEKKPDFSSQISEKERNFNPKLDPVTVGGIYKREGVGVVSEKERTFQSENFKGTIPFYFEIITPRDTHTVYFNAFLESLGDSFTSQVDGTRYIGRAEEVYTYSGFKRSSNFSFTLPSFSERELIPLYHKLSLLAGTTAPSYGETSFMQGTVVQVTIGDFFKDLPGYVTSVSTAWDKNIPWEVDNSKTLLLPHVLRVDLQFQPIHPYLVENTSPFYVDLSKPKNNYKLEGNQKYKISYS